MSILNLVKQELEISLQPIEAGPFVIVPLLSLYPSNSTVQVYVEGGRSNFVVSDGGGALSELHGAGGYSMKAMRILREAGHHHDLNVSKSGWIYGRADSTEMLTTMISLVGDASRTAANNLIKHFKPEHDYNFKAEFDSFMSHIFRKNIERKGKIVGASNKPHSFDYVIDINNTIKIAVDAVTPDANSINSAIVSHLDVGNANRDNIIQYIVYDDRVTWRSADLALLSVGAPPISYREARDSLIKIAS